MMDWKYTPDYLVGVLEEPYTPSAKLKDGYYLLLGFGMLKDLDSVVLGQFFFSAFVEKLKTIGEDKVEQMYLDGQTINFIDLARGEISELYPYILDRMWLLTQRYGQVDFVKLWERNFSDGYLKNELLNGIIEMGGRLPLKVQEHMY